MRVRHIHAGHVGSGTEGITRNVEGLWRALVHRGVDAQLDTNSVPLERLNRRTAHAANGRAAHGLLKRALRDPNVDLVHFHVNIALMGAFARLARRRWMRTPLIVHLWNAVYRRGQTHGRAPLRDRFVHRLFNGPRAARVGLRGASAVLVSSGFQHDQLRDAGYEGPVRVVPNGIDVSALRPATAQERTDARERLGVGGTPTLLYYGHLSHWKGVDTFLHALPSFFREHPEADALLSHTAYGRGGAALRHKLQQLGIEHRVRILGPNHVPRLLAASDVAVVPLVAAVGTACHPNVLLECLAGGLAVVASRVGTVPEVVDHGESGLLFRPGDPADLSRHLSVLAADPALRRRLGAAGRRRIESRFNWESSARLVEGVYREFASVRATALPSPGPQARTAPGLGAGGT